MRDFGVQACEVEKKRKSFRVRTEQSLSFYGVDEVPLWKESWERSERKFQALTQQLGSAW